MLAAAAFTRPQMLVPAFLLGVVYLRKFGAARNLSALSWTVIICFLFIGPFAIAISPSVPVDYVSRILAYHIGNGQADQAYLGISPASYSVWSLALWIFGDQHGLYRMWAPATMDLTGSISYGTVAAVLSIGFTLAVGAWLAIRRSVALDPARYLPVVAFGMLGWLLLTPGVISRYLVYGIVFLILSRKSISAALYVAAVAVLSLIACITMFGHLSLDFLGYSGGVNVLSPLNNPVSHELFTLFSADWFITLAAVANLVVLGILGVKGVTATRGSNVGRLAPAVAVEAA